MNDARGIDITIMGREFRIACPPEDQAALLETVAFLDERMHHVRDASKVAGIDRIAILAALNIAHELLHTAPSGGHMDLATSRRKIRNMSELIDAALHDEGPAQIAAQGLEP